MNSSWPAFKKVISGSGLLALAATTLNTNPVDANVSHANAKCKYQPDEENSRSWVSREIQTSVHSYLNKSRIIDSSRDNRNKSYTHQVEDHFDKKLNDTIKKAQGLCETVKNEFGLPGLVISVSVNGKLIWEQGMGYADLENKVQMSPEAVLRIASISKAMTMTMLAKLLEEGKLDLDCPVQTYVPNFPQKSVDGKPVTITTRHLLSHLSGIRHYLKKGEEKKDEMKMKEYFLKDNFKSVDESLVLFQNDELLHEPGTKYHYTTHGFTVVSKVIENITNIPFAKYAQKMFNQWGLKNTYLDENDKLIYNRARCYTKDDKGRVKNSPYVDNSYKWAGGGFVSNVRDLAQFAHILMYSAQHSHLKKADCTVGALPSEPYLKQNTIRQIWTGHPLTSKEDSEFLYALGFQVENPFRKCMYCKESDFLTIGHGGAAIGASSILYIRIPNYCTVPLGHDEVDSGVQLTQNQTNRNRGGGDVKGIVIVMITNLTDISLSKTAYEISNLFKWLL